MFKPIDPKFQGFPAFAGLSASLCAANPSLSAMPYITNLIADIKIDRSGQMKVIEFGGAFRSSFSGYDSAYSEGRMFSSIWDSLKRASRAPLVYAQHQWSDALSSVPAIALEQFGKAGSEVISSREIMERGRWSRPGKRFNFRDRSTYSAILAYDPRLNFFSQIVEGEGLEFEEFLQDRPWVLRMDSGSTWIFSSQKYMTRILLDEVAPELNPNWTVLSRDSSPSLADEILDRMPSEKYAIKPMDQSCGLGVLVVESDQLHLVLQKLASKYSVDPLISSPCDGAKLDSDIQNRLSQWLDDPPAFMVESYVESNPIRVDGEEYDATGRIVFSIINGETIVHGGYWKLPAKPIGEGSVSERSISAIHARGGNNSVLFSNDHLDLVSAEIFSLAPKIGNIFRSVGEMDVVEALESSSSQGALALSIYLRSAMSESPDYDRIVSILDDTRNFSPGIEDSAAATLRPLADAAPLAERLAASPSAHIQEHALEYLARMYVKETGDRNLLPDIARRILSAWNENSDKSIDRISPKTLVASLRIMREFGMITRDDLHDIYRNIFSRGIFAKKSVFNALVVDQDIFYAEWFWRSLGIGDPFTSWMILEMRDGELFRDQLDYDMPHAAKILSGFESMLSSLGYSEILRVIKGGLDAWLDANQIVSLLTFLRKRVRSSRDAELCAILSFKISKTLQLVSASSYRSSKLAIERLIDMELFDLGPSK